MCVIFQHTYQLCQGNPLTLLIFPDSMKDLLMCKYETFLLCKVFDTKLTDKAYRPLFSHNQQNVFPILCAEVVFVLRDHVCIPLQE